MCTGVLLYDLSTDVLIYDMNTGVRMREVRMRGKAMRSEVRMRGEERQ